MSVTPKPQGWIRRTLPFLRPHRRLIAFALTAALISMGGTAAMPLMLRQILDGVVAGTGHLARPLAMLLAFALARMLFAGLRRYSATAIALRVEYDMRNEIFDHLQRLDFARHDEMQTGQLVSRANTDVRMVQGTMTMIPLLSSNVILFFIAAVIMLKLSWLLTIVALGVLPLLMWLTMQMQKVVYPSSWDASAQAAEVANVVEEAVTGVRVVKGFGQEQRELGRLIEEVAKLYGTRMRNIRMAARFAPAMQSLPRLGQVAILGLGGWLVVHDEITLGTFLAFSSYLTQLIWPVSSLANFLLEAQASRASAERIYELLDSTAVVVERDGAVELDELRGDVRFEGVSFGYLRSEPVLRDFSLEVKAGEVVALVGASGSGKSTVALLLPRFYDLQSGSVRIDGTDVRDATLDSLRRQIGVVFEESFLFSDSVRSNIAYGRPGATDEAIEAAARAAGAHQFILELPDGYDTVVGERGLTLSGGQRQRVTLARAILTDPRILILDDATSSIDARTEEEIHQTLRELMPGRTTIIVAHRRSTLDLADRIVVVDGGRVLDSGTHAELMDRCRLYRELLAGPDDELEELGVVGRESESQVDGVTPSAWPQVEDAEGKLVPPIAITWGMEPPNEELIAAIKKLPPIIDRCDVDVERESQPEPNFTLRAYLKPHRRYIAGGLALILMSSALALVGPALVRYGVDAGVAHKMVGPLWIAAGAFLLAAIADFLIIRRASVYTGRTAVRLLTGLRIRVFAQLQRLGIDFYDEEMAGRIMTRMTSDIDALQQLMGSGILAAASGLLSFFGSAAVLFAMNARLAAVVMLVVPFLAVATRWYRRRSEEVYERVRDRIAAVNANLQESISGVRVAQAYVRERQNMEEFRLVAVQHLDARMESNKISSLFFPFIELISALAQVLVLWFGASFVARGSLTTGGLIAFVLYLTTVFSPIQQLSQVFDMYQQARAALGKIRGVLSRDVSTPEIERPVDPGYVTGDITFEDVHFRYPTAVGEALTGVGLHIAPGQTVALVGETGAGKSTIVKLVARFYDPTSGRILVDGRPLRDLDLGAYRRHLGYVPQEAFLFSGTIRDNIAYAKPDATDAQVEAAAREVGAHDFIAGLPYGYHEAVTERGRSLSSGQRQLIALARAHLVSPAILILDEATSNLDLATEARVSRAMQLVATGRTTVLIAHRLQTAQRADRILVIHDGRVVEDGSHAALVAAGGRYSELWRSFGSFAPEPVDEDVPAAGA